ncbi:MAG: ribosomal protein S18-alanine N-acetyltransferase [bacterium]
MIRRETSLGLGRRADAYAIAGMSRRLIERGLPWSWTPGRVEASLYSRETLVVVARADAQIAGFGIMRYGDEHAHLDLLGVDPDFRGGGLGRRLLEWLEKPALESGIRTVLLEVREENLAAQAFYARLGYRQLMRLSHYYQGRESAVRMGRELGRTVSDASDFIWSPPGSTRET